LKRWATIAISLFVTAYFVSPYVNAYWLAQAFKTGDRDALEKYIDWPVIRQKLKEELAAKLANNAFGSGAEKTDLGSSQGEELGKGLVGLLGPTMINNMVDSYVTPAGLSTMIKSNKSGSGPAEKLDANFFKNVKESVTWAFFDSPTGFVVHVQPKDKPEVLKLKFGFYGNGWKLNSFVLPNEFYEK
jgi:Protein of unknown function (DUF2939)